MSFQKTNKYGNTRSLCSYNHSHSSKLESAVCGLIRLREMAGELRLLQVEDHVLLSGWYLYIPDFKCLNLVTNEEFWIEAKGKGDGRWPSTKKGWRHDGPGPLEIWAGPWQHPFLSETIVPKKL